MEAKVSWKIEDELINAVITAAVWSAWRRPCADPACSSPSAGAQTPSRPRRRKSRWPDWILPLAVGAATGVLSGFGVGGGSLLLIYMTSFAGVPQTLAHQRRHGQPGGGLHGLGHHIQSHNGQHQPRGEAEQQAGPPLSCCPRRPSSGGPAGPSWPRWWALPWGCCSSSGTGTTEGPPRLAFSPPSCYNMGVPYHTGRRVRPAEQEGCI